MAKKKKCWRKESHKDRIKDEVVFYRNKSNVGFVSLSKVQKGSFDYKLGGNFQAQINTPNTLKIKVFKKESQALKFIKSHMKKNNVC